MDDNTHPFLKRVTVLSIGLSAGIAAWRMRGVASHGLRIIGLWSYLAAVNGGRPELQAVLEADRTSNGTELVRPYWGYEEPWLAARHIENAETKPLSTSTAAISGHNA